jgi:hypothetical protein
MALNVFLYIYKRFPSIINITAVTIYSDVR